MVDPAVERHFRMVDEEESIERMRQAVRCLHKANVAFIVEGGWAVATYGSAVLSVDLDVLVPGGLTEEVAQAIEDATGYQMYSQAIHDTLALDFVDSTHANPLFLLHPVRRKYLRSYPLAKTAQNPADAFQRAGAVVLPDQRSFVGSVRSAIC